MTRLQRMKKKSTIQNKSSGDDNVKRSRTGENSRLRRYQKSKKKRCEVSKATIYFLDIIIKNFFFLFQVSPVSGSDSIVLIYKVNVVYRNVRENGYAVNYAFFPSRTTQFPFIHSLT